MKGVSTVIATLLMLIITIAIAGLAYSYISGFWTARTGKLVGIDAGATFCSGTAITVFIKSEGTIDFTEDSVNIGKQGQTLVACGSAGANVVAGGASAQCDTPLNSTNGITQGNNVIVATGAGAAGPVNTVRANIFCPG